MTTHVIDSTHEFAFYTDLVTYIVRAGSHLDIHELTDPELVHRITMVIRLDKGDTLVLFDANFHIRVTILGVKPKKSIMLEIHGIEPNPTLSPSITWLLPLLKREPFEEALYTLTELGAQSIQPVLTRKIHRPWFSEKEFSRSRKIIQAAAEQSKQYRIPSLCPLIPLELWLAQDNHMQKIKLFFDPLGQPCSAVLSRIAHAQEIIALSGPEGDLLIQEKEYLVTQGFIFCALTKTTLRAQQAIAIGLGILRSLL
jgi:16S rRNA (uracil1498-N3)-methyltransferase